MIMKRILFFLFVILICLTEVTTKKSKKKPSSKYPSYPPYKSKIEYWVGPKGEKEIISKILIDVQKATCLKFVKKNKLVKKKIGINFYFHDEKSHVELSKSKKYPTMVYLNKSISSDRKQLSYYIGCALGLIPEVLREDRDDYVKILWENIGEKYKKYFYEKKLRFKTETGFDFSSVMINDYYFGSKNGYDMAYESKFYPFYEKQYDWFSNFSYNDNRRLNELYCKKKCSKSKTCQNGGYHFKTCAKCQCPPGLKGKFCSEITRNDRSCPYENIFYPTKNGEMKVVVFKNITGTCKYFIKSKNGRNVKVEVLSLDYKEAQVCKPGSNVEIRYQKDKGTKGLVLCTDVAGFKTPPFSNKVFIYFNDLRGKNELTIRYYEKK